MVKKNLAASVRQRLLDLSRRDGQPFDVILVMYGLERLLYRLSMSDQRDRFVLKGGMLVSLWLDDEARVTRDIDFLGHGEAAPDHLVAVFGEILNLPAEDGLTFDIDALNAQIINEEQEYDGVRIKTQAHLEQTRIPITIDVGFGDALTEPGHELEYPSLLDLPSATIRSYPPVTVVAEKFQAIVNLGLANSRMKDYYDLWALTQQQPMAPDALMSAIEATFARRETTVPVDAPTGLSSMFYQDPVKSAQWTAYAASIEMESLTLGDVVDSIWGYLAPVCNSIQHQG